MMNRPLSSTGQLARYFVAGPLVLAVALGLAGARAQGTAPVAPVASPAGQSSLLATPLTVTPPMRKYWDGHDSIAVLRGPFKIASAPNKPVTPPRKPTPRRPLAAAVTPLAPMPAASAPVYYVDGQVTANAINRVDPKDIASLNVFKGEMARQLAGDAGAGGIIVITTKQNQNTPAVRAFNDKMGIVTPAPAPPAAGSVPYLAAPALAYITQHYPGARLLGVREVPPADGGALRYQAEIALGRRPGYLLFDGQGQFISESYNSYLK